MDPMKTGEFLKCLRKEKGLTQEQLAEHFYVSARTVSRWETGSNMPDVNTLIDFADFYHVDIREIIDGERKNENMDAETRDTVKKVAAYATEENNKEKARWRIALIACICLMFVCYLLFGNTHQGWLRGILPDVACNIVMICAIGLPLVMLILYTLKGLDFFGKGHCKTQNDQE